MLKATNVSYTYSDTGISALKDFSLSVEPGQIHCLLGASGSGKTTALRLIAGFMKPDGGEIQISEKSVFSKTSFIPVEQRNIGIVFQNHGLLPHLSCRKNIEFGMKQKDAAYVDSLLDLTGLTLLQHNRPNQLSGGQQQRTALARAFAGSPSVLLMDEPFSSLDSDLKNSLLPEIRTIIKKMNIPAIFVTHSRDECDMISDTVSELKGGSVIKRTLIA